MPHTEERAIKGGTILQGNNFRYEIIKVLGHGSFGITYLARTKFTTQGSLGVMAVDAYVALKEFFMGDVNSRMDDGSTVVGYTGDIFHNYRKQFRKEAKNLLQLNHPKIVKVFDVFDANNTTYYAMEYLDGENLDDYIIRTGALREEECLAAVKEIGSALEYMHSHQMLHLDIKPRNIMRRTNGSYMLIDFGMSKQFTPDGEPESSTKIGMGTPGYSPLEQSSWRQDGTFPATLDVYALGATMYKMLTGRPPKDASRILNEGFPYYDFNNVYCSDLTVSIIERCMAPVKMYRYQSIPEMMRDVYDIPTTTPMQYPYEGRRVEKRARNFPRLTLIIIMYAVLGILALLTALFTTREDKYHWWMYLTIGIAATVYFPGALEETIRRGKRTSPYTILILCIGIISLLAYLVLWILQLQLWEAMSVEEMMPE